MFTLKRSTWWTGLISTIAMLVLPTICDAQKTLTMMQGPVARLPARLSVGPRPPFTQHFYDASILNPYIYWTRRPYSRLYTDYGNHGSVLLDVRPTKTEVYIDGYYAGIVDSNDGLLQRLQLPTGEHTIKLRLQGYRTVTEKLYLPIGQTFHVKHVMEQLASHPENPGTSEMCSLPKAESPLPATRHRGFESTRVPGNGHGTLTIRVHPRDATICIDGEEWKNVGHRPPALALGVGRRQIEVNRAGYETYITHVQMRRRETTTVTIALPRK